MDIQDMKAESEMLAQESNEAAKRALRVAEQTRQIGADTLAKLDSTRALTFLLLCVVGCHGTTLHKWEDCEWFLIFPSA